MKFMFGASVLGEGLEGDEKLAENEDGVTKETEDVFDGGKGSGAEEGFLQQLLIDDGSLNDEGEGKNEEAEKEGGLLEIFLIEPSVEIEPGDGKTDQGGKEGDDEVGVGEEKLGE